MCKVESTVFMLKNVILTHIFCTLKMSATIVLLVLSFVCILYVNIGHEFLFLYFSVTKDIKIRICFLLI